MLVITPIGFLMSYIFDLIRLVFQYLLSIVGYIKNSKNLMDMKIKINDNHDEEDKKIGFNKYMVKTDDMAIIALYNS